MAKGLCPDWYFEHFYRVTPAFLNEVGIRYLILDIDNTLAPYEQPQPDDRIKGWFADLRDAGIRCAFVSNNHYERVELFNRELGFPMFPNGKKPLSKYMRRAMEVMQAKPEATAIMGDQIFTDVWAGRAVGIRTILVPPIKDKTDLFTKAKRVLEKPILRSYWKRKGEKT